MFLAGGRVLVKSRLEAVLGFLYPPVCQLCHRERARPVDGYVGELCRGGVRWVRGPYCIRCGLPYETGAVGGFECSNCRGLALGFDWARAAVLATGLMLEVVHRYKYERHTWFERFLGDLLVEAAGPSLSRGGWDCLVPVPLHPVKEREREFNQAVRLARCLSEATGLPVQSRWLRRVRETQTQTRLSRAERVRNMAGAFACRLGLRLDGARVVVVDDVLTTGSTTSDCAWALREAGAGAVGVWTVARGL